MVIIEKKGCYESKLETMQRLNAPTAKGVTLAPRGMGNLCRYQGTVLDFLAQSKL